MTIKEIIKLPAMVKFDHACAGILYYNIDTEYVNITFPIDMNNKEDVGTADFFAEYKPITLMRYIRKAIDNNSLVILNKVK